MQSLLRRHNPFPCTIFLIAASLATPAAHSQVVSLDSATYEVTEGMGQVTLTVLISATPDSYGGVFVDFTDVEAMEGIDFNPVGGYVDWLPGDGSSKQVVVGIVDDPEPEDPETFTAAITYSKGPFTIGTPSQAVITITDNDSGGGEPYAYIDMTGATQNASGEWVVFAPAGDTFDVHVHYTEVPPSPVSVDWTSDAAPYSGTVVFDDTDEVIVTLQLDEPAKGMPLRLSEFQLIQLTPRAASPSGIDFRIFDFFVGDGFFTGTNCWGCVFYLWSNLAGLGVCPFECDFLGLCDMRSAPRTTSHPSALARAVGRIAGGVFPERMALLGRYRDEVLTTTTTGQYYVDEYASWSQDAVNATLRQPMLFFRIMDAMEAWVPALTDLLDGDGTGIVVSQAMVDQLNVVLDAFEAVGDPGFAAKIAEERTKLQVDAMVGLTAAQVQQQIETLGGETPTQEISWGTLKSRFR